MASKAKKGKQISCKKAASTGTGTRPWPELPPQLITLIARQSILMQNLSYGGVSKLWRSAPRQCNPVGKSSPWLDLLPTTNDECHNTTHPCSFNISFRVGSYWWFGRKPYQDPSFHLVGYSQGVVVSRTAAAAAKSQYHLWHPIEKWSFDTPPWDHPNLPFQYAALSSPPYGTNNSTCIVMALTGHSHPAFVYYKIRARGEYQWIKQDCTLVDPHVPSRQFMQFTNAIGFQGRFYALSLQGTLAVIEDIDSNLTIAALSKSRAVPSVLSKYFREYLVESNGEILLIFLIHRKSTNVVDDVEVFRLHFAKLSWVKMESLGDRTFFVGTDCCMFVTASKVGCRGNCVYFTQNGVEGWWVYDMERGCISPGWSDNSDSTIKSPVCEEE